MNENTFVVETTDTQPCWAELHDGKIVIHRTSNLPPGEDQVLLQWDPDAMHNLVSWATKEKAVSAYFSGPMAHQIIQHSEELGMTPEMFVWHAVKVFIEVGANS